MKRPDGLYLRIFTHIPGKESCRSPPGGFMLASRNFPPVNLIFIEPGQLSPFVPEIRRARHLGLAFRSTVGLGCDVIAELPCCLGYFAALFLLEHAKLPRIVVLYKKEMWVFKNSSNEEELRYYPLKPIYMMLVRFSIEESFQRAA